eukprot:scaffold1339_cov129-Skeletonema_dohrnii-CCMP3373.AAC.3
MPPKKKTKKAVTIDPLQIQPNDAVVNAGQNCYPSSRPHATVKYANRCSDACLEYIQFEKKKKAGTMTNSDYREERDVVARRCLSGIRLLKKVDGGILEVVSDPLYATKTKITTLKGNRIKEERIANARASNEIVQVAPEKSIVVSSSLIQFHCEELAEAKTSAESEYARLTRQMSDAKEGDETSRDEYTELRRDIAKNFVQTAQSEGYQFLLETREAFMILPFDQACDAILRALGNSYSLGKSKRKVEGQNQLTKGDVAALIEDDSSEANTTRDALYKNISQKMLLPPSKTSSTGSLAITAITPNVEMDVSCLPSDLGEDVQSLGCIETSYQTNFYPRVKMTMDGTLWKHVPLHQLACCVECGPRSQPISKEKWAEITASHICQNARCINPKHLRWETMRDNWNRQGCYGYVMLKKGSKFKFVQTTRCTRTQGAMHELLPGKH